MTRIITNIKKYSVSFVAPILNVLLWLWLVILIQPTGDSHVLHYNIYFGIDQIGPGIKLYLLPLFGLIVIAINFLFIFSRDGRKLGIYASWLSVLVQIILLASLLLLIINHY